MNKGMLLMLVAVMATGSTLAVENGGHVKMVINRVSYETDLRLLGVNPISETQYLDRTHVEEIVDAMDFEDELVIGEQGKLALSKHGVVSEQRWSFNDAVASEYDYMVSLDFVDINSPYTTSDSTGDNTDGDSDSNNDTGTGGDSVPDV